MSALRGNLADFGIAEVFQLIGQQRKTGFLEISSERERVRLAFDGGAVVRAEPMGEHEDAGLAELLLRCGLATREALSEAQRDAEASGRRLCDLLVERGALTREALQQAEDLLTQETLFHLLRWSDGSFSFTAANVAHDRAGRLLAAEQILMDGLRMVDEWKTFSDQVPSDDLVFQRTGRFEEFAAARQGNPRRLEMARRVFQLVDGRLPVRRVADLSRLGTFEATRILAELRRAGLVEPLAPEQVARRVPRAELRRPPTRPLVAGALPLVLLAALAVIASGSAQAPQAPFAIAREAWQEARAAWETERVRRALQIFRFSHERWPDSLEELVEVGVLDAGALTPSGGRPYHYSRMGAHAVLLAPEE